ncbi:MAG: BhlA/UviB family holin-like peptide [Sarcina sp.]
MQNFLDIIGSQGIFAIFFYILLTYMLREQSKRDARYQENLKELVEVLSALKEEIYKIKKEI